MAQLTVDEFEVPPGPRELDNDSGKILGIDMPLDQLSMSDQAFASAVLQPEGSRVTKRELAMLYFIDHITDKPNWAQKVFNEEIVENWRRETRDADESNTYLLREDGGEDYAGALSWYTDNTFDWCIKELREKAKSFEETGHVKVLDTVNGVVKSDTLIDEQLRKELVDACKPLQDVPESEKDYQPNTDNRVVNLVHPSLYPLHYDGTKVFEKPVLNLSNWKEHCGQGTLVVGQSGYTSSLPGDYSSQFQWLPCEVAIPDDGRAEIKSYINNLHPERHRNLYSVIEKYIEKAIPLWDACLIPSSCQNSIAPRVGYGEENVEFSLKPQSMLPEGQKVEWQNEDFWSENRDDPEAIMEYERYYEQEYHRIYIHPEPDESQWLQRQKDLNELRTSSKLLEYCRSRNLQIIVKLAGLELTPERPSFEAGSWHLEGMANERIVGTVIYYYDSENVTENRLFFRQVAPIEPDEVAYEQSDYAGLEEILGTRLQGDDYKPIQVLGSVSTAHGRVIAFPNTMQHCVSDVELVDKTKPGHRRMLVLWLVDPEATVISTANVPPQNTSWWPASTNQRLDSLVQRAAELPAELRVMIYGGIQDWPMTRDDAEKFRLMLMDERTVEDAVDIFADENWYNLCEH